MLFLKYYYNEGMANHCSGRRADSEYPRFISHPGFCNVETARHKAKYVLESMLP